MCARFGFAVSGAYRGMWLEQKVKDGVQLRVISNFTLSSNGFGFIFFNYFIHGAFCDLQPSLVSHENYFTPSSTCWISSKITALRFNISYWMRPLLPFRPQEQGSTSDDCQGYMDALVKVAAASAYWVEPRWSGMRLRWLQEGHSLLGDWGKS